MNLTGLLRTLLGDPAVARVVELAAVSGPAREAVVDLVGPPGVRPPVVAVVADAVRGGDDRRGPLVVVTATGRDADEMATALRCYLPAGDVAVLPAWETLPHERLSPRSDTVARRLAVFRRLAHPDAAHRHHGAGPVRVLVVPVRALLQPVVAGLGDLEPVSVAVGDQVDLADLVERRGEFAVRGGILDVFPPTEEHPLRVELWGDEVEEIRWFAVADQRSLDVAPSGLWAPPCREILLTDAVRARAAELVEQLPGAAEMLDRISAGVAVEGMESLAPVLVDRMVPVVELLPPRSLLVVSEPERVRRRAHDLAATTQEFLDAAWTSAAAGGKTPIDLRSASFADYGRTREEALARDLGWWTLSSFGLDAAAAGADADVEPAVAGPATLEPATRESGADGAPSLLVAARDVRAYHGDVARAVADLQELARTGWRLVLATDGSGPAQRMVEQLTAHDVPARRVAEITDAPAPGIVHVVPAPVGRGFVAEQLRLAVLTEIDLTGRPGASTRDMRGLPARRRNAVDPLQLRTGDHVVHEQHGVGRFVELVRRTIKAGPAD